MARFLVSGISALVSDVRAVLGEHGAESVGVDDIDDVPAACAQAGPASFNGYIQLPAMFSITGDTAVDRVHHYFRDGALARFPAMSAALPTLAAGARLVFVMGVLPPPVATEDDVAARAALVRLLGNAARADKQPDGLRVAVLGSASTPKEIALTALGRSPEWESLTEGFSSSSYADWRVELLGMMQAEM